MTPTSKMSRPSLDEKEWDTDYYFGDPEIVSVEITDSIILNFKEPSAEELELIEEINEESSKKKNGQIEATLKMICLLHVPEEGKKKISLKDARKLTARQLKKIGDALEGVLGLSES